MPHSEGTRTGTGSGVVTCPTTVSIAQTPRAAPPSTGRGGWYGTAGGSSRGYRGALSLADYRTKLEVSWPRLRIFDSELLVEATEPLVVGTEVTIRARIDLAGLDPSEVDIQAVVGQVADDDELRDAVTVPMLFRAAMGDRELARLFIDAEVLRPAEHEWLAGRVRA